MLKAFVKVSGEALLNENNIADIPYSETRLHQLKTSARDFWYIEDGDLWKADYRNRSGRCNPHPVS
jgi:hypothetical protein